jgi:YVTN family beta-propeller protein
MRTRTTTTLIALTLLTSACSSGPPAPGAASTGEDVSHDPSALAGSAPARGVLLPTGVRITPTAARGASLETLNPDLATRPDFTVDHAVATALSPDGATLLVLTSGYNLNSGADGKTIPSESSEYVFVYDVRGGAARKAQVLAVPNTFHGIAFAPAGDAFYVTGGVDDSVHVFTRGGAAWMESGPPIALGHAQGNGLGVKPAAAGIAVTRDGTRAVVANFENDSITIVDLAARKVAAELDLRPGKSDRALSGVPGGEFPFWVSIRGSDEAYVSSTRDGEVVVVSLGGAPAVKRRIGGLAQPGKSILDREGRLLFVANAGSDTVSVIETATGKVIETIATTAPRAVLANGAGFKGANPNALALSPDERTLYVTNAGTNSVAVVRLAERDGDDDDDDRSRVVGLVPTGWYPSAVSVSADGARLFVANAKSVPGPNPDGCRASLGTAATAGVACSAANEYVWQLEKASFLTLPVPGRKELAGLTLQVARNNQFPGADPAATVQRLEGAVVMGLLRRRIKHVVYVIKENRTYDQVLGDLKGADGEPRLALFPEATTPNHHAIAQSFVALDRFQDSGETSGVGWNWSTAARTTDVIEKTQPVNYAGRGLSYDWEGTNRNVNVGYATVAERVLANPFTPADPDLLPGTGDVSAPDAAGDAPEAGTGHLWDAAMRRGLTVRNYGFFGDLTRYSLPATDAAFVPLDHDPHASGTTVFFPAKAALVSVSDPYFRGYDQKFPDFYRFKEWAREQDAYEAAGSMPALELVRLPHDHFGTFGAAIDGVNTPERQMADNDYAVGLLVEKISKGPFAADTLVFVLEDDAQDGPDHVDAHRSVALVAGPYVKQGAVISTAYTTVNVLRTIEEVLGLSPLGLNDALAAPMADLFEWQPRALPWTYEARVPDVLRQTALPLPPAAHTALRKARPAHDAAWWDDAMRGQRFDVEDALDADRFNRALWRGLAGGAPYPVRAGAKAVLP